MSVLIKGMEMPKCCDECPLGEYEDSEWFSCRLMDVAYRHMAQCDRLDDCPLVALPEKEDTISSTNHKILDEQKNKSNNSKIFKKLIIDKKGYYSIIYDENGEEYEGYSSFSLDIISDFLKEYFL